MADRLRTVPRWCRRCYQYSRHRHNGEKRGPVLALVSGAHGTEYTSVIAIEKLIRLLDPSQIAGIVILVPLVNIQSFEQKVPHVNPVDNKSMNRFYPGEADGNAN